MTLEQLENIPDDEWGRASSRLLQFFKTRYDENECFPEGNSIEDLVNGAIADLIAGKRQYYVDQDLFWQLYEIIRSNFCKLFRSADCKKRNIIIASDDEKTENFDVVDFCELPVIIDDESFLQQLEKEISLD